MINNEIRSLTGIRGIAAIYVALFHFLWEKEQQIIPTSISRHLLDHGYLSVDLFFILSGFVITLSSEKIFKSSVSRKDYLTFLKKRFSRIYPAYVVALLLACILIKQYALLNTVVLSFFLLSIFSSGIQVLGVFWSLSTEWIIYLIFPFWSRLAASKSILTAGFLLLVFVLCYGTLYFNFSASYRMFDVIESPWAFLRALGSYSLGIFAANTKDLFKTRYWVTDLIFGLIILCLSVYKLDVVIVFLFCLLVRNLATEERSLVSRFSSSQFGYWLGMISYSFYLIHQMVQLLMEMHFAQFKHDHLRAFAIGLIFISVILAHFFHKYIEMPLSVKLRKRLLYQV